jgi:hypothetical protein
MKGRRAPEAQDDAAEPRHGGASPGATGHIEVTGQVTAPPPAPAATAAAPPQEARQSEPDDEGRWVPV